MDYPKRKIKENNQKLKMTKKVPIPVSVCYIFNYDTSDVLKYIDEYKEYPSPKFEYELWKSFIYAKGTKKDTINVMSFGGKINLFYPDGIEFELINYVTGEKTKYGFDLTKN